MIERDSNEVSVISNMHLIKKFILKLVFACKFIVQLFPFFGLQRGPKPTFFFVQLILLECISKQKFTLPSTNHNQFLLPHN